eukprot:m.975 g.975  ORF g.975 m.975 type:complete len:286 (+) comp5332_c0_seq1:33-890(+)
MATFVSIPFGSYVELQPAGYQEGYLCADEDGILSGRGTSGSEASLWFIEQNDAFTSLRNSCYSTYIEVTGGGNGVTMTDETNANSKTLLVQHPGQSIANSITFESERYRGKYIGVNSEGDSLTTSILPSSKEENEDNHGLFFWDAAILMLSPDPRKFDEVIVRIVFKRTGAAVEIQGNTVVLSQTKKITTHIRILRCGAEAGLYVLQSVHDPSLFITAKEKDGKVSAGSETEYSYFKLFSNSEGSMAILCNAFQDTFTRANGDLLTLTNNPLIDDAQGLFVFQPQ